MIFYKFSETISDYIIKDIKEEIPKINNVLLRKEGKGYFFYNKDNMKTGKISNLSYSILKNVDNKLNCGQIFVEVQKSSNIPLVLLSELFIVYMKNFQNMELINMSNEIDKKINPKMLKEQNKPKFLSAPIQIAVLLTNKCNLKCSHCGNENRERKENELTKEEWFKIIDDCVEIGVFVFNASGGEPFIRKDWYDILYYARKKGIDIGITSNGTLIDRNIARKLQKLDIFNIHLSLDGIGEVHDDFRNKKGVFKKVINSIKLLKEYKIPFGVTTAISKRNLQNVDEIKNFVKENKINSWEIYYAIPIGCMEKKDTLDGGEITKLARKISEYKKELKETKIFVGDNLGYHSRYNLQEGWKGCQAGLSICAIDSEGNVKGCPIHPNELVAGSLKNKTFSEIWNNKNSFVYNRRPQKLDEHCKKCGHKETCRAGCKASMYSQGIKDFKHNDICLHYLEKN